MSTCNPYGSNAGKPHSGPAKPAHCTTSLHPESLCNQREVTPFAQGLSTANIDQHSLVHRQTKKKKHHSAYAQDILETTLVWFISSVTTQDTNIVNMWAERAITHLDVDIPTDGELKYLCELFQAPHTHTSLISWDTEAIRHLATTFNTLQARSY